MNNFPIRYVKHLIKGAIGKPDPHWPVIAFEQSIHPDTWKNRASILAWAEKCLEEKSRCEAPERYAKSTDPLVKQGYALKLKTEEHFRNCLAGTNIRLLIHVQRNSTAGYSLFKNFAESFAFIGITTKTYEEDESFAAALEAFKPTVFLSSDHSSWLSKIDWDAIAAYREKYPLRVGLTAGLEEYGNTPLTERLAWAKEHKIDFYYSYRDSEYLTSRKEYRPFFDAGYSILLLPFGANILHYYPVPDINQDLAYAFLASKNGTKAARYIPFLRPILSKYPGIFDGPGWDHIRDFHFNRDRDRYLYARSKVGLNVSVQEQVDWACEVNERTYMLAACGVPQITDNAKLLPKLFSERALFVAKDAKEYREHFETILKKPELGIERALIAQREVFEKHTTFHRAQSFIEQLLAHKYI